MWNLLGVYHSVIYFFGIYAIFYYGPGALASNGKLYGVFDMGTVLYTCVIYGVNIKVIFPLVHVLTCSL